MHARQESNPDKKAIESDSSVDFMRQRTRVPIPFQKVREQRRRQGLTIVEAEMAEIVVGTRPSNLTQVDDTGIASLMREDMRGIEVAVRKVGVRGVKELGVSMDRLTDLIGAAPLQVGSLKHSDAWFQVREHELGLARDVAAKPRIPGCVAPDPTEAVHWHLVDEGKVPAGSVDQGLRPGSNDPIPRRYIGF